MEYEPRNSASLHEQVRFEIEFGFGDVLDGYKKAQGNFFSTCCNYADEFSSKSYEAVESSAFDLEFTLTSTIYAIASRKQNAQAKLEMVHGFIVADDSMRTDLFRKLAPDNCFIAFSETESSIVFPKKLPSYLRYKTPGEILNQISSRAIQFLQGDVLSLGEAIAIG